MVFVNGYGILGRVLAATERWTVVEHDGGTRTAVPTDSCEELPPLAG
jgi:hypothetical protein